MYDTHGNCSDLQIYQSFIPNKILQSCNLKNIIDYLYKIYSYTLH